MTDRPDPLIGALCGEYRIEEFIGAGGMGRVYRARHELLDREVALKLLVARVVDNEHYVQRFLREAKIASSLHHPSLVEVYDFGSSQHGYYMIMELIKGMSLARVLASAGKLNEDQVLDVAEATLSALSYAHSAGVVHRDIKPDNLLIQEDGSLKLTDLGLAKASYLEEDARLTQSGMVLGTPFYVSPEQVQGSKNVDIRTDFYSLGATLYHCATGHFPFTGETSAIIMNKHLHEPAPNPSHRVPELTSETAQFILRLMNKNPDYRFAKADDAIVVVQRIRDFRKNPNKKIEEVIFIDEPTWKDNLPRLIIPVGGGFLLIFLLWWVLLKPIKQSVSPLNMETDPVPGRKKETEAVVMANTSGSSTPPISSVQTKQPENAPLPSPPPAEPALHAGLYRVQIPNVIKDGYFKGKAGEIIELTHSDALPLGHGQNAFLHFDIPLIVERMSLDLGQEPEIRRVDLIVVAKIISPKRGTKVRLFRLNRNIEESFSPSDRALSEMTLPESNSTMPLKFNVSEDVLKAVKKGENFGWCLMLEGEGEIVLASSQEPQIEVIPSLIFTIGIKKELLPKK